MEQVNSLMCTNLLRLLATAVFSVLAAGIAVEVPAQEAVGYISPNQNDLPPDLERDVALRSTDADRPPAYGPANAKVLVVTFADFGCPACRRASQATHQIAGEFPGEVRIEFWNNPLEIHRNADVAAAAGIAAQRQGRFWEMHDLLFASSNHDIPTLEEHAQKLGLDLAQFRSDMNDPEVRQRIRDESSLASALGARATPGYVVNGKVSQGWSSWKGFRGMVQRELTAANELAGQGIGSFEIQDQRAIANNIDSETYNLYRNRILEPNFKPTKP